MPVTRTPASVLADTHPHGLFRDAAGRVAGFWAAQPAMPEPDLDATSVVLCIVRVAEGLAFVRTESTLDGGLARAAAEACRPEVHLPLAPARPREDARTVVALMAATMDGGTDRDWFVPRLADVSTDLAHMLPDATEAEVAEAAGAWVEGIHRDVGAFLSSLDPGAVALSRRGRVAAAFDGLPWGAFDATFAGGGSLGRALSWMPDLPILLRRTWDLDPAALAACGRKEDLGRLVARRLATECSTPRMARIAALAADALSTAPDAEAVAIRAALDGDRTRDGIPSAVDLLAGVPPNWIPSDAAEWRAYLATGCHVLRKATSMTSDRDARVRLVGAGRGWADLERRVRANVAAVPSPSETASLLAGVDDVVRSFARQVAVPCMTLAHGSTGDTGLATDLGAATGRILLSGRSLPTVLGWSERWHGAQARIQATLEALPREGTWRTGWPPALPDVEVGGFRIVVLGDAASLADEGEAMAHCVGGYSPECRAGVSRILSFRRGGTRVSTAELRFDGDGVTLAQHRGPGNGDPSQAEGEALAAYLEGLRHGTIAWRPDELVPVPEDDGDRVARDAGYEWWRPGHVRAALDAWRPSLPRRLRALDPDDWVAALTAAREAGAPTPPDPEGPVDGARR